MTTPTSPRRIRLKVASPCNASWEQMEGDDAVRFCRHCQMHVYELSAMTTAQVDELLATAKGRLCARIYQRADGTVITSDCAEGRRRARRRRTIVGLGAGVASVLSAAVAIPPDAPRAPQQSDLGQWAGTPYRDPAWLGRINTHALEEEVEEAGVAEDVEPVPAASGLLGLVGSPGDDDAAAENRLEYVVNETE